MTQNIKLGRIPDEEYSDYRYEVIFKSYKWDPQVEDCCTVSKHAVLLDMKTARELEICAEKLAKETLLLEEALLNNPKLAKELALPKKAHSLLRRTENYSPERSVRLMRFDFHPTASGWAISEVNSDVPGGIAEGSILPSIAAKYFDAYTPSVNTAKCITEAFKSKVKAGGRIAFVHATSYSDDRQVMQCLGDYFNDSGFHSVFMAPDHIRWENQRAISILEGEQGKLDGIIRFFPLEWLENLPKKSDWKGYYNTVTPSCNHPAAMYTQSKRLPVIWDKLTVDVSEWKRLLPETLDPKSAKAKGGEWIYKPALGRVGEGISIKEAISKKELRNIEKAAKRCPKEWVAQKRFESRAIDGGDGIDYHLCIGVFTVDAKFAGFYARISPYPRIDSKAQDIPVLVKKDKGYSDNFEGSRL